MIKSPLAGACLLALAILMSPATAQETSGIHEVNVPAHSLSWAPVAGSDYWVATWDMGSESYYAVSRDAGRTTLTTRHAEKEIGLRYFRFDPLRETPLIPEELTAVSDARLMILQSTTQILEPYQESLAALGVEVLHRLPKQSLIVRMDGASKARVEALPWVRWVGPCHPAYKLDRQQLLELATGNLPTREYNVQVTRKGLKEKLTVGSFVRDIGGQVHEYTSPHGYLFRATLDRDQLLAVIARDDVLFADVWSPEEPDMDKARILGGADYVETVGGYTGAGVRGQVRDTGLDFSHPDWQFAPIPHNGTSGSVDHGSCVYGIVFGSGGGNAAARGLLPDGQGFFHSSGTTSDRYIETGQLLLPPIRAVFETNSTGSNRTTEYTTISADMDNILFDHDVVVLQSQSNAGSTAEPRDSRPQAWAKNIVAVGGIRHYDTLTTTDDAWNGAGSIGPAADGRLKPDVSMFYDATLCAEATGAAGYTSGNYYSNFGGTSGATPICAGYMGLIHQMWADGIFGNALVAGDVFDNKPHATLAKALMINSASPYAFSGIGADLARYKQGWGRPDLQRLYDRRLNVYFVNETDLLGNLQSTTHVLTVLPGETEFHATMVYSDPAGNPGAAMHRINDLTLKVTDPSGTIYWGNNGLAAGNVSTPGGSANLVDTVENVIVLNPAAGTWLV
ncbi:MAG: S8 family serine peptidase, partial [Planctomycetes bacterium]|nr:S8 family serine peptidase [Planctomycetota bacterium]